MKQVDLTVGSIPKKIIIVALPLLLSNLIGMVYSFTDMFWISQYDQDAVNAVGVGGMFIWFASGLGLIATLGTKVFVASNVAKNKKEDAIQVGVDGLKIGIVTAIIYSLVIFILHNFFVSLFGYESEIINNYANDYLKLVAFVAPLIIINEVFSSIANGHGNAKIVFIISFISLGLNVVLDPIFINVLDLGVKGAAYATIIAAFIATLIWIIYMARVTIILKLKLWISHVYIMKIIKFGIVPSLLGMLFPIINMFVTKKAIEFGDDYGGVIRVGAQIESFSWAVGIGLTTAVTIFFAQNFAVKKFDRMEKVLKIVSLFILGYGLALMGLFIFGGDLLFSIFYKGNDTIIGYGEVYLLFLAFSLHAMLFEGIFTGALNGLEKSSTPATISFVGNLIRIPLVIILGAIMGINGIWITYVISSTLKAGVVFIFFTRVYNRKKNLNLVVTS